MWRRALVADTETSRGAGAVAICMAAVRSFYEWSDGHGLLLNDVVAKMTHIKYFAPGTAGGGEHGARRRVLVDELRMDPGGRQTPRWIDDAAARDRLTNLVLPLRDRFLVDLLTTTGIRAGEALSLFTADIHFGGGGRRLGCVLSDPHFHVRIDNPVQNNARAKGGPRALFVHRDLVDSYIDYALERRQILAEHGIDDGCPHVFVNLYSEDRWLGRASSYSSVKRLIGRCSRRIGYDISWSPHVASYVRHPIGAWRGLRPGTARRRSSVARARLFVIDAGLHPRHGSSDESGHHRDDCPAGPVTGWHPVTALATQPEHSDDDRIVEWRRHLLGLLDRDWRPGEFDPDQLMFIPASRRTNLKCVRDGCDEIACRRVCARSAVARNGCPAWISRSSAAPR